jgi:endonuclease/exonuclease/phosphatase (EEP) superfamily protein YafD
MLRIDHVFGTGIRATEVEVHRIKGSDHAAIVADLEVVT